MPDERFEFFKDYDSKLSDSSRSGETFVDPDREYPIESRCCITGEAVKHSFCRYPDSELCTLMVMSRETMVRLARKGGSLSDAFERVIQLRRQREKRKRK